MEEMDTTDDQSSNVGEVGAVRMSEDHNYAGPEGTVSFVGRDENGPTLERKEKCVSDHAYAIGDPMHRSVSDRTSAELEDMESCNPVEASEHICSPSINNNNSPAVNDNNSPTVYDDNSPTVNDNNSPTVNDNNSSTVNDHISPTVNDCISPAVNDDNSPTVNDDNSPAANDDNSPGVNDDNSPAVNDDNSSAVNDDNSPTVNDDNSPAVNDDNSPAVNDDNSPAVNDDISPALNDDNSPSVNDDNSPAVNDDNSPAVNDDNSPAVNDDNSPAVNDNSAIDDESVLIDDGSVNRCSVDTEGKLSEDATLDVSLDSNDKDNEEADNKSAGDSLSEAGDKNMDVVDDKEKLDEIGMRVNVTHNDKELDAVHTDDKSSTDVLGCERGEKSSKGDTAVLDSDDDRSNSDDLVMNISDNDDKSDKSDVSVSEEDSEDEQIMLLSPVKDSAKDSEVQDDGLNEAELSEANNNCLSDKSVEQLKQDEVKTVPGANEQTVTENGNENDSETTEDYSVTMDSKSKSDDEEESGDEDKSSTVESKEMEIQTSLDRSDIESGEETEVKTSGRKRKKPASFGEFLTNDDEINEEVKKARKMVGDGDQSRGTKDEKSHPGRSSASVDLELLLEPFKHGWMRELVYRSTGNTACDTYYFAPEGRKLRSLVQVADHLERTNSPLTCSNFSFSRRILHKPPFELVRQAGRVGLPNKKGSPSPVSKTKSSPQVTPEPDLAIKPVRKRGRPPKNKGPKMIITKSRPTKFSNVEVIIERDTDEVSLSSLGVIQTVSSPPPSAVSPVVTTSVTTETKPVTTSSKNVVLIKQEQNIDFNISALLNSNTHTSESDDYPKKKMVARKSTTPRPKLSRPEVTSSKASSSDGEMTTGTGSNQLCTLACPGLEGTPPTLQCFSCICLFHPECVNYQGTGEFLCFICHQNTKKSPSTSVTTVKVPVVYGITESTVKTPVSMEIQTPQSLQMIYQTQSSITSPAPSLYTLKLTPNNGLIPSLQPSSSSSVIRFPGLPIQEPVNAKSALRTALDKRIQSPLSLLGSTIYKPPGTNTSLISTACTSIPSPVISSIGTPLPTLISAGVLSANNADMVSPAKSSLMSKTMPAPPRLTLAPGAVPPASTSSEIHSSQPHVPTAKPAHPDIPLNAQLLTLPQAVTKRLKLSQPLALKINNIQVVVPPSCVIGSADGLKVLLPPNTFPLPTDPNQKLSVTVSNNTDPEVKRLTEPLLTTSRVAMEKGDSNKKLSPGSSKKERKKKGINPASCFIKSLYGGYDCMLEIFKYLKTADVLRATCVCRTWQQMAKQPCLWRSISLRGLTVTDWDKATRFFKSVRLESLSLMGMCHSEDRNKTWHNMMSNLHNLTGLTTIEFGLVPAAVLHMVCEKLTGLEVFRAEFISDATGDQMWSTPCKTYMGKFAALSQLKELKLRGIGGLTLPTFSFSGGLGELGALKHLVSLSLTTLRSVPDNDFHFLRESKQLEELELGDCTNWSSEIYFVLGGLTNLKKLRLECGGEIPDIGLSDMLQNLKDLEVLELIMFQIADTFGNAVSQLEKLQSLVIWPDTTTDVAAVVNSNTLTAVSKMTRLKCLEWGVVSSDSSADNSGNAGHKQEYIPILPECVNQQENSDVALLSERISIKKLTEKLCSLLPHVSIRVFNTKVVPHSQKNGSS